MSRPFTGIVNTKKPEKMISLRKQNNGTIVNSRLVSLVMHKLPVILLTEAGSSVWREAKLTRFSQTQVVYESKSTKIHDADDKLLRIIGSMKRFVSVGPMEVVVSFSVCKQLVVPAILGCAFCDQHVERTYSKTRFVTLLDAWTESTVRHYGKQRSQRSAISTNLKTVPFLKEKGRVFHKISSTQRVGVPSYSQTTTVTVCKQ